jgi:hypothetical protein
LLRRVRVAEPVCPDGFFWPLPQSFPALLDFALFFAGFSSPVLLVSASSFFLPRPKNRRGFFFSSFFSSSCTSFVSLPSKLDQRHLRAVASPRSKLQYAV